jgi:hypothetical protein
MRDEAVAPSRSSWVAWLQRRRQRHQRILRRTRCRLDRYARGRADAIRARMDELLAGVTNPSPAQNALADEIVWPWVRTGALSAAHVARA